MGWICKRCGSENRFGESCCRVCLTESGALYRLGQRREQRRQRRMGKAAFGACLDRKIRKEKNALRRQDRVIGRLTGVLAVITALLVIAQALVLTQSGTAQEIEQRMHDRLEKMISRMADDAAAGRAV